MTEIMRAYRYHAFPPACADEIAAFEAAVARKRVLWRELIGIQDEYAARKAAIMASDEIDLLVAQLAREPFAARQLKPALARARKARAEAVAPDLMALGRWRIDRQREAKQRAAADGLHWGDYNAVVNQFEGATRASAARGAKVYNFSQACGEAAVNQIIGGCSPAMLFSGTQVRLAYPTDVRRQRIAPKPGSRRSKRRVAGATVTLRGPRNPLGPASLHLECLMERPLPPDAIVKEVRVVRRWSEKLNRTGELTGRHAWSVIFVCVLRVAQRTDSAACGIAFDWARSDDGDDALQRHAVLADARGQRDLTMEYGHADDWALRADWFESAGDDPAALAEARRRERRLQRRRQWAYRNLAADIARRYAVVALQDIDLGKKGAKLHTAPHEFRLAVLNAVTARGGTVVRIGMAREKGVADPARALAKNLYLEAKKEAKRKDCSQTQEIPYTDQSCAS